MANTEKTDAALEQLTKGIQSLVTSDRWVDYLKTQARFHRYSFGNTLLIALQRPDAQRVAGFHAWKDLHRSVSKGAKGISILAPNVRKVKDEEDPSKDKKIVTGFRVTYVFDIADTEGEPLPEVANRLSGEAPEHIFPALVEYAKSVGFTVDREDPGIPGANGVCRFDSKSISVRSGLSPAQAVKTLAHEIAHATLHESMEIPRQQAELEAESVAFVVCNGLGIQSDDYSFGYVTVWGGGENAVKTIKASGTSIQKTARGILDALQQPVEMEVAA